MKNTEHSDQAKLCLAVGSPTFQGQKDAEVLGTIPKLTVMQAMSDVWCSTPVGRAVGEHSSSAWLD